MLHVIKLVWKIRKIIFAFVLYILLNPVLNRDNESATAKEAAGSPADLSKAAWKRSLIQTKVALKDKDLATSAAALAYYLTLSFFPVVLGLASVYVALTNPASLLAVLKDLSLVVPPAIAELLQSQLAPISRAGSTAHGIAIIVSIVALIWATSGGLQNLVKATNKAYGEEETRGRVKLRLISIGLSVVVLTVVALILGILVLQGDALHAWGAPDFIASTFPILRWPLLIILISFLLAVIYRYAPNRKEPKWQWVSWGAVAATLLWLIVSALFFIYVQSFADFNKTYGTFAGIVVLMTWFNFSSLIVLLGAQVNHSLETKTTSRSTVTT